MSDEISAIILSSWNEKRRDRLSRIWRVVCSAVAVRVRAAGRRTTMTTTRAWGTASLAIISARSTNIAWTTSLWRSSTNRTPSLCSRLRLWSCCTLHWLGTLADACTHWLALCGRGHTWRGVFSKRQRIMLRLLYAIAIPSVVCLSVCRLWRWCTLLRRLNFSAIFFTIR